MFASVEKPRTQLVLIKGFPHSCGRQPATPSQPEPRIPNPEHLPLDAIHPEDMSLAECGSLSGVRSFLQDAGLSPQDVMRGINLAIEDYVSDVSRVGVRPREIRAFLRECGACEERIARALEFLTNIGYFFPGRDRWFSANSPLIGFTAEGTPFYKGSGYAPKWIETDGMC